VCGLAVVRLEEEGLAVLVIARLMDPAPRQARDARQRPAVIFVERDRQGEVRPAGGRLANVG